MARTHPLQIPTLTFPRPHPLNPVGLDYWVELSIITSLFFPPYVPWRLTISVAIANHRLASVSSSLASPNSHSLVLTEQCCLILSSTSPNVSPPPAPATTHPLASTFTALTSPGCLPSTSTQQSYLPSPRLFPSLSSLPFATFSETCPFLLSLPPPPTHAPSYPHSPFLSLKPANPSLLSSTSSPPCSPACTLSPSPPTTMALIPYSEAPFSLILGLSTPSPALLGMAPVGFYNSTPPSPVFPPFAWVCYNLLSP
ncbi:hypothetical protein AMTR_s00025p00038910 [Amborella trichopoda]|uniref:Uncharacterized protein n=1 Tax=Amborella trichopoda TaxID=13333 RepID=W1PWP0_AMBTC|nr:hypothetical protein AMTR_s00025p00038910 [Amborella trichopoda]